MRASHPLVEIFVASRPRTIGDVTYDHAGLEGALARMLAEGRAACPSAKVDDETYVRYVAGRAAGHQAADLARLHAGDLYLACACFGGDEVSVVLFDRTFLAPLPKLVATKGISLDEAADVVQALRERLFVGKNGGRALIGDYDGRGALAAWVRVAAIRSASKMRRDEETRASVTVEAASDAASPASLPVIDPALAIIKRRYGEAFEGAIRDAFASLDEEGRNILRLHFTDGLNLDAIARVLGLSRATVGRRMVAARTRVREETLRLLGERITATPTELISILGVVRSSLDVSLFALVS